jgi:hypothetical protein
VTSRHSPLSGDYTGHDEVIAFFTKTQELAAGTFSRVTPEQGGPLPSIDVADALLDERREL